MKTLCSGDLGLMGSSSVSKGTSHRPQKGKGMAQGVTFSCNHCGHSIEAWDDGNPYYLDERGKKRYAYHPSSERDQCVGNDSPHICLSCGFDTDFFGNTGDMCNRDGKHEYSRVGSSALRDIQRITSALNIRRFTSIRLYRPSWTIFLSKRR